MDRVCAAWRTLAALDALLLAAARLRFQRAKLALNV